MRGTQNTPNENITKPPIGGAQIARSGCRGRRCGEVTPITSVDDIKLGEEYPEPITAKIAEHYAEILAGNVDERLGWLTPI